MKTDLFDMVDMDYLFTVITADRAVEYTGKEVYVADSIKDLEFQIKEGMTRTLEGINSTLCELRFNVHNDDCTTSAYALCVPADKVIKHEKKLRPFKSIDEFKKETGLDLLSTIQYRYIIEKPKNLTTTGFGVITDFCTCSALSDKAYYITIGDTSFNLDELFDYEYLDKHGNWHPFGVEE